MGNEYDDDTDLWRQVTRSITPIRRKNHKEDTPDHNGRRSSSVKAPAKKSPAPTLPYKAAKPVPKNEKVYQPIGHADLDGIDRRTAARFKAGKMPIEARLDLHGLTQQEAFEAFGRFIDRCSMSGKRCVLVITGKGGMSRENRGVLREKVPQWINLPPLRARVLSFTYALPRDGGTGALYILLRRNRV